jgi:hypothetical protein
MHAESRATIGRARALADLLFRHAVLLGDLVLRLAVLLEAGKRLVLVDRVELLGGDGGGQRIFEGLGVVDLVQGAADRLVRTFAVHHAERGEAAVAVGDREEPVAGVLDDEVFDLSVGVEVGRKRGDALIPAGDAGVDALAVFVAELEHLQRDLDIHGGAVLQLLGGEC